jgi:crossover junction endodeoxyribonuclease RuvC
MIPRCICGVDPGISGAVAFYYHEARRVACEDMPVAAGDVDTATLADRIKTFNPILAVVELAHARPGQGVSSMFRFGRSFGAVLGVLGALRVPVQLVPANRWKKHFGLGADKEASRALALRLFPANANQFKRKMDHNRAEAALIARFAAEPIPA